MIILRQISPCQTCGKENRYCQITFHRILALDKTIYLLMRHIFDPYRLLILLKLGYIIEKKCFHITSNGKFVQKLRPYFGDNRTVALSNITHSAQISSFSANFLGFCKSCVKVQKVTNFKKNFIVCHLNR